MRRFAPSAGSNQGGKTLLFIGYSKKAAPKDGKAAKGFFRAKAANE